MQVVTIPTSPVKLHMKWPLSGSAGDPRLPEQTGSSKHSIGRNLGAETVSSGDRIGVSEGMLERLSHGSGQAAEHDSSAEAEQEGM